jgi:hypothetical protein
VYAEGCESERMFRVSGAPALHGVFLQLDHGTFFPTGALTDRRREQRAISYALKSGRRQQNSGIHRRSWQIRGRHDAAFNAGL